MAPGAHPRFSIHRDDREQHLASFAEEVERGLGTRPRSIP
jgi:hypothetical protein